MSSRVIVDIESNRLTIVVRGYIDKKALDSIYTDIRFAVADLAPGFNVITDLSEAGVGYLCGISTFQKIAHYLKERQVGTIVRIVPTHNVIVKQLVRLSERIPGYQTTYVSTLEEALARLEAGEQRQAV